MNAMNEKISAIPKSLSKRPSRDMAIMNYVGAPDKSSGKYRQNIAALQRQLHIIAPQLS